MKPMCGAIVALVVLAPLAATSVRAQSPRGSGYVDSAPFRALIEDSEEIVEVNLEGPTLQALARSKGDDREGEDAKDLFMKLKSIHAVIGTVRGSSAAAMALVRETDQKLFAAGWQRVTRIKDETSSISVLTHTVGDKIDGLVAIIFDSEDRELVFANLAGEIDITRLGEIGDRLNVPGLDQVPGAR